MLKTIIFFLAMAFCLPAFSEEVATEELSDEDIELMLRKEPFNKMRKSYLSLDLTSGKDDYRAQAFSLGLGVSKEILLKASVSHSKSLPETDAGEARLGINWKTTENLNLGASLIGRTEPLNVKGKGLGLNFSYLLSSLWKSDLMTTVFVDGDFVRYTRTDNNTVRIQSKDGIPQNALTLGFTQDLHERLFITYSHTAFAYGGENPAELSQAIGSRPNSPEGLNFLVLGFPKYANTLEVFWQTFDSVAFSLTTQVSESAIDGSKTNSIGIGTFIDVTQNLMANAEISTTSTSAQNQGGLLTLGLKYEFDFK